MPDTVLATSSKILKSVGSSGTTTPTTDQCPEGITVVLVEVKFKLKDIVDTDQVFSLPTFVKLPQARPTYMDGNSAVMAAYGNNAAVAGVPWVINSYLGISDFKYMTAAELKSTVLTSTG